MIPSRWLVVAGAVMALVGLIELIWNQIDIGRYHDVSDRPFALVRLDSALQPLTLVALGILVVIGAELLDLVRSRERP